MKQPRLGQVLRVVWDDAASAHEWVEVGEDIGIGGFEMIATGRLVRRDAASWTLAINVAVAADDPGKVVSSRDHCRIPKGCILSWSVLEEDP